MKNLPQPLFFKVGRVSRESQGLPFRNGICGQILSQFSLVILLTFALITQTYAGEVDPELARQLSAVPSTQMISVIISLKTRADTNVFKDRDKSQRRKKIVQAMRDHAGRQHPALVKFLQANGATAIKPLWIVNSVAAKVPASLIGQLANRPAVARVSADGRLSAPVLAPSSLATPEWNLLAIHAPELWGLGYTGSGVVVANMDSGVDGSHPDLAASYRGGSNSWFDPYAQNATPRDNISGHGTQTMGLMVAGDAGGSAVGTAPGAQWIAAKIFNNQGIGQESEFHQSFQWLLDPDENPATDDAPDVVNGSFQSAQGGICDTRFQEDIQKLKTAGIAVVFAAGNSGPGSQTSSSPANNPGSFAAGAVDDLLVIDDLSARGPAPVDCGGGLFPHLVAPGVDVRTTDPIFGGFPGYATVSGTSFAAPHVAGAMALLIDAFPAIDVSALESALLDSATDLGDPGPDNVYGHGMLNVLGAYVLLAGSSDNPLGVGDGYQLDEDSPLTVPAPGVLQNDSDPQSQPITALLDNDVSHGSLVLNADGSFNYTPTSNYFGTDNFSYRASDGVQSSGVVTVVLTIIPVNDAPVAQPDVAELHQGETVAITVLANDGDVENSPLTPVIDSQPINGSASVNNVGHIVYSHNGSQTVSDSFSYHVTDADLNSNTVTVSITLLPPVVNSPPIANPDCLLYRPKLTRSVNASGPFGLGVLLNDSDAQNDVLTMQYVDGSQSGGGILFNASDGSLTFTRSNSGKTCFRYRAFDGTLSSNPASVCLYADAPPVTKADSCLYDISDNVVSKPERCTVLGVGSIKMAVAANDSDPDSLRHIPSDGVGSTVLVDSLQITKAGKGIQVLANPQCGQAAIGAASGSRGTLLNNCDGTVSVNVLSTNSTHITYSYKISDDLGAQSRARAVCLTVRK